MRISVSSIFMQRAMFAGTRLLNLSLFGEVTRNGTTQKFEDPIYIAPLPQKTESTAKNAFRILFVGNSITRHGIAIDNLYNGLPLKWDHVAGMAAISETSDYAHRFGALIQKTMPKRKVELYFEGVNQFLKNSGEPVGPIIEKNIPQPHLVVIQTGEHEGPEKTKEEIAELYEKMLIRPFCELKPRPLILCAGIWFPSDGASYAGWVRDVDEAYKAVCSKYSIPYISVERLAADPSCRGWGENPGVKWHPNDKGMEGYAHLLFEAFQKN